MMVELSVMYGHKKNHEKLAVTSDSPGQNGGNFVCLTHTANGIRL